MRLLVCGDRNWTDREAIERELRLLEPSVVIEGECRGADLLAREVAEQLGISVEAYPPLWSRYGRAAGPERNHRMLTLGKPDLVLAFHSDIEHSKGTKNMLEQARRAGLRTKIVGGPS